MKKNQNNYLNRRAFFLYGMLVFTLQVVPGCDDISVSNEKTATYKQVSQVSMDFNAEFRYVVGYDQKTWSFTTLWPDGLEGRINKDSPDDKWLLDRYELVREQFAFDSEGRMYTQQDWLDGDADLTLPLNMYEAHKDKMPVHGEGHDPVVKSLFGDGSMRYITASGKTAYSYPIDTDVFRIDPGVLEEIIERSRSQEGSSDYRDEIIARLQSQEISFSELGKNHLIYTTLINDDTEFGKSQITIDVRNGQVVHSVNFLKDGKIDTISFIQHKTVNGIPVMEHSNTAQYGMRDGQWAVTGRTLVNRENIHIFIQ